MSPRRLLRALSVPVSTEVIIVVALVAFPLAMGTFSGPDVRDDLTAGLPTMRPLSAALRPSAPPPDDEVLAIVTPDDPEPVSVVAAATASPTHDPFAGHDLPRTDVAEHAP